MHHLNKNNISLYELQSIYMTFQKQMILTIFKMILAASLSFPKTKQKNFPILWLLRALQKSNIKFPDFYGFSEPSKNKDLPGCSGFTEPSKN
jgi:hypothetical protein